MQTGAFGPSLTCNQHGLVIDPISLKRERAGARNEKEERRMRRVGLGGGGQNHGERSLRHPFRLQLPEVGDRGDNPVGYEKTGLLAAAVRYSLSQRYHDGGRSQSAACGEKHGWQDEIARQERARQAGERRGDLAAELLQVGHELGVA